MKMQKRHLTLLEIMIVIFLIGVIGSVVGVNIKGSLDKAKVFRTEQAMNQTHDVLLLQLADGYDVEELCKNHKKHLKASGMIKDVDKILKDGWGKPLRFIPLKTQGDIRVVSDGLKEFQNKKNKESSDGDENQVFE